MHFFTAFILFLFIQDKLTPWNVNENDVLLNGYDLVSYFAGKPTKGSDDYSTEYNGVNFYFSSKQNLESFKSSPEKYLPKYGGYCAYAMGLDGSLVKINPSTYKIIDGELYLFYNFWGNNTLTTWNKEEEKLQKSADQYWSKLIKM